MTRKATQFTMRFEVTNALMSEGQKAEASVKRSAMTVDDALILGRAALAEKGFTVGRCTDIRSKLQAYHTIGR